MRADELAADLVLDFGCGKGELAIHLADRGSRVIAYDPDPALQSRLGSIESRNLLPVYMVSDALARGPFDLVICRRVVCQIDDDALANLVRDLRSAVAPGGRVLFALCHPVYTPTCVTPEATPETADPDDPECTFTWTKRLRASGRVLQEMHRPEHRLRRLLRRAGLRVEKRLERPSIDLERFEPIADLLVYELVPAEVPNASLLIKASAMEAETLDVQVRHLVRSLEEPGGFAGILLALDARTDDFLRQHTPGDLGALGRAAERLRTQGWVDRIIQGPTPCAESRASNRRWFGLDSPATHAASGAQLASTLKGFDACTTRYVLHTDADIMIGRRDPDHDYLADMLAALEAEPRAVSVAFNIAHMDDRPYSAESDGGPWRTESRIGLLDLRQLGDLLPLPNELVDGVPRLPWHRALDQAFRQSAARSLRGGDRRSFFVHPQNDRKAHRDEWFKVLDQVERGLAPQCQVEQVDWTGHLDQWLAPERFEPFVFVIAGRNVPPGRFRRCLDSVLAQRRQDWGALVIDDATHPTWSAEIAALCARHRNRISLIRRHDRQGLLANTVEAIRHRCGDPASVIITLDADDCLIGNAVLDALAERYADGADVTVGSMLRTDKHRSYPAQLDAPRAARGGNVWQHLRSFRKALFDAIPDQELRQDGEYVELANDWAYMLPIVELAQRPMHIETPLYLHEPSGKRDPATIRRREAVIAELVSRPPLSQKLRMAQGEGQ
jgi:SAM-dependent methyltransferase/GT2 family glycosyltransferase